MSLDRVRQRFEVVTALEGGNDPSLATGVRDLANDLRHRPVAVRGDVQPAKLVAAGGVEARGDQDKVGLERQRGRLQRLRIDLFVGVVSRARAEGNVEDAA